MSDEPAAFGVYVHWPFCLSKCPYCDFNSHVRAEIDEAAWRNALLADLAHEAALTPGRLNAAAASLGSAYNIYSAGSSVVATAPGIFSLPVCLVSDQPRSLSTRSTPRAAKSSANRAHPSPTSPPSALPLRLRFSAQCSMRCPPRPTAARALLLPQTRPAPIPIA